jgi:hypothetical protein
MTWLSTSGQLNGSAHQFAEKWLVLPIDIRFPQDVKCWLRLLVGEKPITGRD